MFLEEATDRRHHVFAVGVIWPLSFRVLMGVPLEGRITITAKPHNRANVKQQVKQLPPFPSFVNLLNKQRSIQTTTGGMTRECYLLLDCVRADILVEHTHRRGCVGCRPACCAHCRTPCATCPGVCCGTVQRFARTARRKKKEN